MLTSTEIRPSFDTEEADDISTEEIVSKFVIIFKESFSTGVGGDTSSASWLLSKAGDGR